MACNIKGSGIQAVMEYLKSLEGEAGMEKIRQALTPADREVFNKQILPISWVDHGYYLRMIVAADKALGKGDYKIAAAAARYNMNKNFKGLYRLLISFTNPKFILDKANLVWRQWNDKGMIEMIWENNKKGTIVLTGMPDIPPLHEINLTPSFDEVIRISGGKNVSCVHTQCVLKGSPACHWKISWE